MLKSLLFVLSSLLLATIGSANNYEEKTIFSVGSTSVSHLIEVTSDEFYQQTGYRVLMRSLGSDKGIIAISEEVSQIGVISRYLTKDEQKRFPSLRQYTIAQDAIVLIANIKNPVKSLSTNQVREIYTQKSPTWPNSDMTVFSMSKNLGHGTHDSFLSFFDLESSKSSVGVGLSFKKQGINQLFPKHAVMSYERVNQAVAYVFRRENGLAYESLGAYQNFIRSQSHVRTRLIALDEQPPVINTKVNPNYAFKRPLNIIVNEKHSVIVQQYIDFLISEDGQKIIADNYFIPFEK